MTGNKPNSPKTWVDPDDAPDMADPYWDGKGVVHRGRPKSETPKIATTIRIDADILERFREGGRGWQTRINAALRDWLTKESGGDDEGDIETARSEYAELKRLIAIMEARLEARLEAERENDAEPSPTSVARPAGA
jgi:hypothetical protein